MHCNSSAFGQDTRFQLSCCLAYLIGLTLLMFFDTNREAGNIASWGPTQTSMLVSLLKQGILNLPLPRSACLARLRHIPTKARKTRLQLMTSLSTLTVAVSNFGKGHFCLMSWEKDVWGWNILRRAGRSPGRCRTTSMSPLLSFVVPVRINLILATVW